MRKVFSRAVMTGFLVLGLAVAGNAADSIGAFKVKDGSGKEVTQEALKGNTSLLIVAQTACSQCRTEMRDVNARLDEIQAKANVYVILVDANAEVGLARYTKMGFNMPVLLDPMFRIPDMAGITASPATMIVDKDLNVTFSKVGYRPNTLDKIMEQL